MTYFSFAIKTKDIVEEPAEKKKGSPFDIIFKIFNLINEKNIEEHPFSTNKKMKKDYDYMVMIDK